MYQLVSQVYDRQQGVLVIELRKRFSREMAFPLLIVGTFVFIWLLFVPPLFLLAIVLVGLYFYYSSRVRVILYYDAGALRVVRNCDFGFWQWRKQTLHNRANVPLPVYWARVIRVRKNNSFHLDGKKIRQYQMRFPFADEQNLGIICVCKAEWQMRLLQKTVDEFFTETPYNKSQYEPLEMAVTPRQLSRTIPAKQQEKQQKKHIRDAHRETRNRASRFDETKKYAFDRGEKPIRRGDVFFDRGELKSDVKLQQIHQKSYKLRHCSMVKVEEDISVNLKNGTLKLVSTTPSLFSNIVVTLSIACYRLLMGMFVIAAPLLVVAHLDYGKEINRHIVPRLQNLVENYIEQEQNRQPFEEVLQNYVKFNEQQDEKAEVVFVAAIVWSTVFLIFVVFSRIIHWPFWGQWGVKMQHTDMRPYEIMFSSRNDRTRLKEVSKGFVIFFRIIPAMPKTNRLLTGRPFFTTHSNWRQPHQVVFITDEGSFALPCGSVDEQEQIVKRVRRFVSGILGETDDSLM